MSIFSFFQYVDIRLALNPPINLHAGDDSEIINIGTRLTYIDKLMFNYITQFVETTHWPTYLPIQPPPRAPPTHTPFVIPNKINSINIQLILVFLLCLKNIYL